MQGKIKLNSWFLEERTKQFAGHGALAPLACLKGQLRRSVSAQPRRHEPAVLHAAIEELGILSSVWHATGLDSGGDL